MNYLKILAVDDDTNVTAYIKTELESEGWEVVTANSGENAVDITEKSKPDLVVLDLRMPNLDG
jgi:DNA-binding response OmpR family regulator